MVGGQGAAQLAVVVLGGGCVGGGLTVRAEPLPLLGAPRMQVAVRREQVHVARTREQCVETRPPLGQRDRLRSRAVDDLDRPSALQRDRRRRDTVDDELAPALVERTVTQLLHLTSVPARSPAAPAAAGG